MNARVLKFPNKMEENAIKELFHIFDTIEVAKACIDFDIAMLKIQGVIRDDDDNSQDYPEH